MPHIRGFDQTMEVTAMVHVEPEVIYTLPPGLTQGDLNNHSNWRRWMQTIQKSLQTQSNHTHPFHKHPFRLHGVHVIGVNYWQGKLGFIFSQLDIHNKHGQPDSERLPGVGLVRGGSVAMLIILQPLEAEHAHEEFVILTVQPRYSAGSLAFIQIPAGMIDANDHAFTGTAAREIKEECGLDILEDEMVNLTELAVRARGDCEEEPHLQKAVYSSPGLTDEFTPIFLVRKRLAKAAVEEMRGKHTGLRDEGEKITLKIVRLHDLWKEAARDAKALSALALYDGLKRTGMV